MQIQFNLEKTWTESLQKQYREWLAEFLDWLDKQQKDARPQVHRMEKMSV